MQKIYSFLYVNKFNTNNMHRTNVECCKRNDTHLNDHLVLDDGSSVQIKCPS